MEASNSSETLVIFYQTIRLQIPEVGSNVHITVSGSHRWIPLAAELHKRARLYVTRVVGREHWLPLRLPAERDPEGNGGTDWVSYSCWAKEDGSVWTEGCFSKSVFWNEDKGVCVPWSQSRHVIARIQPFTHGGSAPDKFRLYVALSEKREFRSWASLDGAYEKMWRRVAR
jgi:hypothetical protein